MTNLFNRKAFLFLLLTMVGSFVCHGQDFRMIPANTQSHFRTISPLPGDTTVYVSYGIDSFSVDGPDTLFYLRQFGRPASGLPGNCAIKTHEPGIFGSVYRHRPGQEDVFYNRQGQPVLFYRFRSINDPWVMYVFPNGHYIEAEIVNESYILHPDTWYYFNNRWIRIQAKDANHNPVPHPLNDFHFYSAYWQGLWQTVSLYDFPNDTTVYYMAGSSNLPPGFTDPLDTLLNDFDDIYDFIPGQEFHYKYTEQNLQGTTESWEQRIVLSSQISPNKDTMSYQFLRVKVSFLPVSGGLPDTLIVTDTIQEVYLRNEWAFLDALAGEVVPNAISGVAYVEMFSDSGVYFGRMQKTVYDHHAFNSAQQCLAPILPGKHIHRYAYQLGCTFLEEENLAPGIVKKQRVLQYYQRGLEHYGEPFSFQPFFTEVKELSAFEKRVKIFPNPTGDQLHIQMAEPPFQVQLTDVFGKTIFQQTVFSDRLTLSLSLLPPGIYFAKIQSNRGVVSFEKIVKK